MSAPMQVDGGGGWNSLPVADMKAEMPAARPIAVDSMYPSTPVICPAKRIRLSALSSSFSFRHRGALI